MKTKEELATEKVENVALPIALAIAVGLCYLAIRFVRWAWDTSIF